MARVMIADDSDAIRLVLQDILAIGEHELVAEAKDGAETLEKFYDVKPDVLLLDLAMPKKDGLAVLKDIKATTPAAKIIVITAADSRKIINECLDAGATSYISKP
ncbi:MAG: response regulator, partial [Nitrosopumilaceae archaeon]